MDYLYIARLNYTDISKKPCKGERWQCSLKSQEKVSPDFRRMKMPPRVVNFWFADNLMTYGKNANSKNKREVCI